MPALKGLFESNIKNTPSPILRKENSEKKKNKYINPIFKEENIESPSNQRGNPSIFIQNTERKSFEASIRLFRKISNKKLKDFSYSPIKTKTLHVYSQLIPKTVSKNIIQKIK